MQGFEVDSSTMSQLPTMLASARAIAATAATISEVPEAAASTGSPPASVAITALGAQLGIFVAQLVGEIDDTIDGIRGNERRYQQADDQVASSAAAGTAALTAGR